MHFVHAPPLDYQSGCQAEISAKHCTWTAVYCVSKAALAPFRPPSPVSMSSRAGACIPMCTCRQISLSQCKQETAKEGGCRRNGAQSNVVNHKRGGKAEYSGVRNLDSNRYEF